MLNRLLACLLALLPLAAQGQTAAGRVVSQTTGAPVPDATVRLEGQPAGTRTDEDGRFRLPVSGAAPDAPLRISHLGYEARTVPLSQLGPPVGLAEVAYQIGEVSVTYERLRTLLLREWKIDPGSVIAVTDNYIAHVRETDTLQAAKLLQRTSGLRAAFASARLVFLPNGTVKTKWMLFSARSQWELDEAQRTLHLVGPKGAAGTMTVVELTANRLVVSSTTNPERQNEVYIPAN
ncbi:carboxypeptidase-like regulatory domain-containing protein [Hymenobacter amundsenii]|nr:carboxypeptidase-like regulatory domain-containing protein [Hymenobacter amundsenii]